jgi:hypothetical protein
MIDRDRLYSCVSQYFGPIEPSTNNWHSATCPYCGKPKLAVNFDQLVAKCWKGCFRGFIVDLIKSYLGISYFETRELIESMEPGLLRLPSSITKCRKSDLILPRGFNPILSGDTILGERARNYLTGRGFDLNYMDRMGVGYCDQVDTDQKKNYFGYIIIPFKQRGLLAYYIGRDFIDNYPRYKNPEAAEYGVGKSDVLFNEEALYLNDKIFLTEGWACAATFGQTGVSMQGSTPSTIQKNIIIKSDIKEVVVVPDAGYYMNGLQTARDFINHKEVKVLNLDHFEAQGKGKDVNEIGLQPILDLEKSTPLLDMGKLFKAIRNYERPIGTR